MQLKPIKGNSARSVGLMIARLYVSCNLIWRKKTLMISAYRSTSTDNRGFMGAEKLAT